MSKINYKVSALYTTLALLHKQNKASKQKNFSLFISQALPKTHIFKINTKNLFKK